MPLQADFSAGIFEKALFAFFQSRTAGINVDIDSFIKCAGSEKAQQIITTLITSSEQFNDISACYKTDKGIQRINNFVVDITKYKDEVYVAEVTADACNFAKKLITMPGNMMSANDFEAEIKSKFASIPEVKLSVLNKKDLESKKMGLILAVGKQSTPEQEPRIIIAEYNNAQDKKKLAVVGKGITFDTGGLNIKTDNHMIGMHADMAGAAISLATMYVAAKLKINTNLVCLACCVSNETGPEAYRVNDVITAYNGKTVEISNTDAEGRLALADGVSYANKDLKADTIITVATLTGALRFALGTTFTGI
jgi:leucyl aminopeptidase